MSIHGLVANTTRAPFKTLDDAGLHLTRQICLVCHAHKHLSPVLETFVELVRTSLFGTR
jgi:DNA-binding transcriptional LysR family regulator